MLTEAVPRNLGAIEEDAATEAFCISLPDVTNVDPATFKSPPLVNSKLLALPPFVLIKTPRPVADAKYKPSPVL